MKETRNIFYVYEHWRPDTGTCFYVGKGKARRAWDLRNDRNERHMAVVAELTATGLTVDVRIVVCNLSSATAFALEIDRIAFYGLENLTNMNAGGGGVTEHSLEALAKISAASKGRKARLGFKSSQDTKDKQRAIGLANARKFRQYAVLGPKALARPVRCLDDSMLFESARAAERFYGAAQGSIVAVCLKKPHRYTALGKRFEYVSTN